ncbi:electron transport complex subunit RsxA [Pseudoflavonifractor sp. HCP28S3_F10]|uniref:electron transport complex subunit RsxA n=1 Tax=Pseudoflavonifractor sp. HCP28S3_F10 TaxID=3438947 RepID=UPI002A851854|nr:electron transport complex subunit RsxA [Clostridiales bacterium]MDY4180025.1 electron transport complex subunit RsxA [Pseudoflavonifractor sp.]
MDITKLLSIALGAILVNNFILSQFLGICPFMGVSKKMDTALGMGMAVIFVMGLASAVCWPINEFILVNPKLFPGEFNLGFMQTIVYILVIACLVQFVEMFLQKAMPALYSALGIYLPLITTNCAVLGVVLLNTQNHYNFIESVVYGVTGGIGFLLAIVLFASVRERLEFSECPKAFEGFPIALVTAGLIALAFMGFTGLKIW